MLNQKGQASDLFKFLVAAIVAYAVLQVLIAIVGSISSMLGI